MRLWSIRYVVLPSLNCSLDRTFVKAWHTGMRIHEVMAENRLRFSQRLNEMSEELASLAKEVDKNRKQVRGYICLKMSSRY